MIYLDASSIIAILGREDDAASLAHRLKTAGPPYLVAPPTAFEAIIGLSAKKARASHRTLDGEMIEQAEAVVRAFLADISATEVSITPEIGRAAVEAAKRYGRAVGSPAKLNFGDCFAYACAKAHGAVLLYKGEDFAKTDMA